MRRIYGCWEGREGIYLMFLARYLPMVFDLEKIGRT